MTQHNNWKDEFDREFLYPKGHILAGLVRNNINWDKVESFIETLLIKRTKEVLEILDEHDGETLWGDKDSNEVMKVSIDNYKIAVKDDITKLIDTEE